jgi:hypothetical protein
MQLTTHTERGIDKTIRYGWVTKDEPGTLRMLDKSILKIHAAYQRDLIPTKVKEITAHFSWISFGALVVAERNGEFYVIDGGHRLAAALRRSDITILPCVVFKTEDIAGEARAFLDLNTGRKPVTAIAKQRAMVVAGDDVAVFVQQVFDALGLQIKARPTMPGHIKCVAWCTNRAAEDRGAFRLVLSIGAELCTASDMHVQEKLLDGLWVLHARCGQGLHDKRLVKRLRERQGRALLEAANRAAAYYAQGGGRVWASGMLDEINKGLHRKFTFDGPGHEPPPDSETTRT